MAGSGSRCQFKMSENITGISRGGEKASIFPDVILVRLSQRTRGEGAAKLLIEFDGASAALCDDIRRHSLVFSYFISASSGLT